MFRDITTLFKDPVGFRVTINELVKRYTGVKIDRVAGIEARGFIVGSALAYQLGVGFIPIRKRVSFPQKRLGKIMNLNMARIVSRCTWMRFRKVIRCCWWMT